MSNSSPSANSSQLTYLLCQFSNKWYSGVRPAILWRLLEVYIHLHNYLQAKINTVLRNASVAFRTCPISALLHICDTTNIGNRTTKLRLRLFSNHFFDPSMPLYAHLCNPIYVQSQYFPFPLFTTTKNISKIISALLPSSIFSYTFTHLNRLLPPN